MRSVCNVRYCLSCVSDRPPMTCKENTWNYMFNTTQLSNELSIWLRWVPRIQGRHHRSIPLYTGSYVRFVNAARAASWIDSFTCIPLNSALKKWSPGIGDSWEAANNRTRMFMPFLFAICCLFWGSRDRVLSVRQAWARTVGCCTILMQLITTRIPFACTILLFCANHFSLHDTACCISNLATHKITSTSEMCQCHQAWASHQRCSI